MSAGMAEVIAAHGKSQLIADMAVAISTSSITDRPILSLDDEGDICIDLAKLADSIIAAGYGGAQEAKEDAFTDAVAALRDRGKWARSEHGPYVMKTGYDEDGHGNAAQDVDEWYADWLEQFPYREAPHGID